MQGQQLMRKVGLGAVLAIFMSGCGLSPIRELPKMGPPEVKETFVDGQAVVDTLGPYRLPDFAFLNQDSLIIRQKDYDGKVYVADFFFTTCSTICPVMNINLKRVWDVYKDNPDVMFLSHTIDPDHDDVTALKAYKEGLEVTGDKWNFVTGEKAKIFDIAQQGGYFVTAKEDPGAVDGRVHTAALVLVDQNRHIRGHYDGTKEEQIQLLIEDIQLILDED